MRAGHCASCLQWPTSVYDILPTTSAVSRLHGYSLKTSLLQVDICSYCTTILAYASCRTCLVTVFSLLKLATSHQSDTFQNALVLLLQEGFAPLDMGFSTEIAVYLAIGNDTRQAQSYYGSVRESNRYPIDLSVIR